MSENSKAEIEKIDKELAQLLKERLILSKDLAKTDVNIASFERDLRYDFNNSFDEDIRPYADVFYNTVLGICSSYNNLSNNKSLKLISEVKAALENSTSSFPDSATVVCQGVEGAYSQIATDRLFRSSKLSFAKTFEDVFTAIDSGKCKYGIIPIENSTAGSVTKVYDLMMKYNFNIVRSVRLKIDHNLLVKPGTKLSDIKIVTSHEQAIAQCSTFLAAHPEFTVTPCANTAIAAKTVAEAKDNSIAALSSISCASLYGLEPLMQSIQDEGNNHTRFICISKELEIYLGANRTSIMLTIPHRPGSLYHIISCINALGVNMTKLESRPIPNRNFEFMFYFDLEADVTSPNFIKLLNGLSSICDSLRYLGSYSEII